MARFLEIDNTATTEGIAGIHYLNMDLKMKYLSEELIPVFEENNSNE